MKTTIKSDAVHLLEASASIARTIRNAGSHTVTLARGSDVLAGEAFDVLATNTQIVYLSPGESLWAICAKSQETTLEVI